MRPVFRATTSADAQNLADFLRRNLNPRPDHPLFTPSALQWKYWQARPDWDGSRSYIVERDGQILAHGAAWPVHLEGEVRLTGFHLFDWAADAASPGMGAAVLQRMASLADLVWVAGGSDDARRTRAATGFRAAGEITIHALPLHPVRLEWTRGHSDWKTPARWLRNRGLRLRAPAPEPGWEAFPCVDPERLPPSRLSPAFHSSIGFSRYYSECPVARMRWYEIGHNGAFMGYFLLAETPGQIRLAEASLQNRAGRDAWRNLAGLAVRAALNQPDANEIVAWTNHPDFQAALTDAGFLHRGSEELMVRDPAHKFAGQAPHFQMLQGDMAFLHGGRPAYLC